MGAGESTPQQQGPTTFENPNPYYYQQTAEGASSSDQQEQQQAYAAYDQQQYQQQQQQWSHQHAGYEHPQAANYQQYGSDQDPLQQVYQQQQQQHDQAALYQEQQQYAAVSNASAGQDAAQTTAPASPVAHQHEQQQQEHGCPVILVQEVQFQQPVTSHHQQHTFSHSDPSGTYEHHQHVPVSESEASAHDAVPDSNHQQEQQVDQIQPEMQNDSQSMTFEPEVPAVVPTTPARIRIPEALEVASPLANGRVLQEEAAAAFQRLRREKERELNEIQGQYSRRLRQAEDEFARITRIQEDGYKAAIEETSRLFIDPPTMVCEDHREQVRECYRKNKGHALNCFRIVQDFFNCVSVERGLVVHRSIGASAVAGTEDDGGNLGAAALIFP